MEEEFCKIKDFFNFFDISPGAIVLNVGCGFDFISHELSKSGFMTVSLDISFPVLKASSLQFYGPSFIQGDARQLPLKNNCIDAVIDNAFLHCLISEKDRTSYFREIKRILKNEGKFFLKTMTSPISKEIFPLEISKNGIAFRQTKSGKIPVRVIKPKEDIIETLSRHGFELLYVKHFREYKDDPNYTLIVYAKYRIKKTRCIYLYIN